MSAHTADSQHSFQLPSLSYIDVKWEEPSLRVAQVAVRPVGIAAWLARRIAAFTAWQRDRQAASELSAMSDRELMDIGMSRADVGRAFSNEFNADLQQRGA